MTLPWASVAAFRKDYRERIPFYHDIPFLLKKDRGHEGEGIFFISDPRTLDNALMELERLESFGVQGFISQTLIPSVGNALRIVVMGRRLISYWKRPLKPGQVISTISHGARIDGSWRWDLILKGEEAAGALIKQTRINLAALDFVFPMDEPDPLPLILEINYFFGRRGLGGSEKYYVLLFQRIQEWVQEQGLDPESVRLV